MMSLVVLPCRGTGTTPTVACARRVPFAQLSSDLIVTTAASLRVGGLGKARFGLATRACVYVSTPHAGEDGSLWFREGQRPIVAPRRKSCRPKACGKFRGPLPSEHHSPRGGAASLCICNYARYSCIIDQCADPDQDAGFEDAVNDELWLAFPHSTSPDHRVAQVLRSSSGTAIRIPSCSLDRAVTSGWPARMATTSPA